MRLIERYVLGKIVRAFLMSMIALSVTVWLTQALREFDLVSAMGQTIVTFFQITLLLLPPLTTIVAPVALMIAIIYTFSSLNDGSELVVINASGAPQSALLKPAVVVAVGTTIFMASMTLYFSPLSLRMWREMITDVRGSVVSSLLKEGEFTKLAPGLTFQLRQRAPDGTLRGIFLADSRDDTQDVAYLAERGAVLENPLGVFLVMSNGTIQQKSKKDNSISIIQFTSYAYDLSTLASKSDTPSYRPAERTTSYLFQPDPNDRVFQSHPERYSSELYTRFATPLNALVFGLLPLMFLAQAETTRQGRAATIALAIGSAVVISIGEFLLNGATGTSIIAAIALFVMPIVAAGTAITLVLAGVQLKPPERLLIIADAVGARITNLSRGRTPAAAPGE